MAFNNLKAEMKRLGIAQYRAAELLGMGVSNFNMKVNERIPTTIDEAKRLKARFFPELSLDYLFASDGNVPSEAERARAAVEDLREAMADAGMLDEGADAFLESMHAGVDSSARPC